MITEKMKYIVSNGTCGKRKTDICCFETLFLK